MMMNSRFNMNSILAMHNGKNVKNESDNKGALGEIRISLIEFTMEWKI